MTVRFGLRDLLERLDLSQSEASRRTGVSFATINRMCTDATAQVHLSVVDRLCRGLGVKPGDLFRYVPEKGAKPRGKV